MPKCMNTDLILNRDRKQSSTLTILDHPQNQIKIEESETNGSDKKSFSTSTYLQKNCKRPGVKNITVLRVYNEFIFRRFY